MVVRDAMRAGVISCVPGLSLHDAAKLMTEMQVRALVVVEEDCGLVGILSQTDLVNATLGQPQMPGWQGLTVGDVMSSNVLTVTPDASLSEAARLMVDSRVQRLVVVENEQAACTPIGVLSMGDVVRSLSKE